MNEDEVFAKRVESLALLDEYELLLAASQREALTMYLRFDLSLSEIAEEKGISRAAAFDAVKKGIAKLESFESNLHLLSIKRRRDHFFEEAESARPDELNDIIQRYKEDSEHGI